MRHRRHNEGDASARGLHIHLLSKFSPVSSITHVTDVCAQVRFRSLIRDDGDGAPRKSILKRETQSFDEYRRDRGGGRHNAAAIDFRAGLLDRKAKSFEEREEEYERCKLRIFKRREAAAARDAAAAAAAVAAGGQMRGDGSMDVVGDQQSWPSWGGSDSSEHDMMNGSMMRTGGAKSSKANRLLKVHSLVCY